MKHINTIKAVIKILFKIFEISSDVLTGSSAPQFGHLSCVAYLKSHFEHFAVIKVIYIYFFV
jgi:hypothetical protein